MKHLFKKLLFTIAAIMTLSACGNLLPSMPGFLPSPPATSSNASSNNNGKSSFSSSSKASASSNSYDGPYHITFQNSSVTTKVGERTSITFKVTNAYGSSIAYNNFDIDFSSCPVEEWSVDINSSSLAFVPLGPCSSLKIVATAKVKDYKYTASGNFSLTVTASYELSLSDQGTISAKRGEWHKTSASILNIDTSRKMDIHNYECWLNYSGTKSINFSTSVFHNYTNNCFDLYIRFDETCSAVFNVVVMDNKNSSRLEKSLAFSVSGTTASSVSISWDSQFIVGTTTTIYVALCDYNYTQLQKIQSIYIHSENEEILPSYEKVNVNTENRVGIVVNSRAMGQTNIVVEVLAANGNTYYDLLGINVFDRNSFYYDMVLSGENYDQSGYLHLGQTYTMTITGYLYLDGSKVQIQTVNISETTQRYSQNNGIKFTYVGCDNGLAIITFALTNAYLDLWVDVTGYLISAAGYNCLFGYGFQVYEN